VNGIQEELLEAMGAAEELLEAMAADDELLATAKEELEEATGAAEDDATGGADEEATGGAQDFPFISESHAWHSAKEEPDQGIPDAVSEVCLASHSPEAEQGS
jgi:hypothetical protein